MAKKAEQSVHEHEDYNRQLAEMTEWLSEAQSRYSECQNVPPGQHDSLSTKQAILQVCWLMCFYS